MILNAWTKGPGAYEVPGPGEQTVPKKASHKLLLKPAGL